MYQFRKRQGQSKSKMIWLALLFPMVTSMSIDIRFAQCTSRDMKLQESQTAGMTFLGCASLCKGRDSCEEFQFIDGLCTLGDNSLPESLLRTVTEGCYYASTPYIDQYTQAVFARRKSGPTFQIRSISFW